MSRSMRSDGVYSDLAHGLNLWRYWWERAKINHRLNYQDAKLGLLWPNFSLGLVVAVLGSVWGVIFEKPDPMKYFLYLSVGYPVWQLLANCVNQGLLGASGFGKSNGLPLSSFLFERIAAIFLRFMSVIPIVLFCIFFFGGINHTFHFFWIPFAFLNLVFWSFGVMMILTVFITLRPDIKQLISAFMGLAFLATPVIWEPSRLGDYQQYIWYNPFFVPLEFARYSLTGILFDQKILFIAPCYTLLVFLIGFGLFAKYLKVIKFRSS